MKNPFSHPFFSLVTLAALALAACTPIAQGAPGMPGAANTPEVETQPGKIASPKEEMVIYIADHTADCMGVGAQTCLLYRSDSTADYELFYSAIEGFEYVPGFEYELRVLRTLAENPPADGSLYHWTLIEVVGKTETVKPQSTINMDKVIGTLWGWTVTTSGSDTVESNGAERYTIQFNADGTYNALLDCNHMQGTYTLGENEQITLTLGPTTLMACPEGTLDSVYAGYLATVATLTLNADGLTLTLQDGSVMGFAKLEVATEPEQTTPSLDDLVGKTWQWVGKTDAMAAMSIGMSENYTIEFLADGTYSAKVDCNLMHGTYTLEGASLKINLGAMTRMACPEGSLDSQFVQNLEAVAIVFMKGDSLYMDLFADSGTLQFSSTK